MAVGVQVAVAGTCVVLGWQLLRGHNLAQAVTVHSAVAAPAPAPATLGIPGLPAVSTGSGAAAAKRPGPGDILERVNRDDARLYRGQWTTIQVLARATRDYTERHIVPLLLAAARGASR
ncbi:MAG TPA: hypothetical protein VGR61_01805 [Candidatus Dormibacteraeota bacterium]|nr:hypothetical protein [Candidatus Dormibacteraeota bacterium]